MAGNSDFDLDTKSFATAAKNCKSLAEKMQNTKFELSREKNAVLGSWVGEGRNTFEKKYRLLEKQFNDINEQLWAVYENIVNAEVAYIQADTDAAKRIDGIDKKL